jgi:peptide/nickel transport system ATP-binding protein
VFHPRCSRKLGDICEREAPPCVDAGDGHTIRCHIPLDSLRALAVQRRSGHHDG